MRLSSPVRHETTRRAMSERRIITRQRTFLQGRLFFNNRRNSVDCIIRDISDTGARLQFSAAVTVPDALELYVPNKDCMYRVRAEWRHEEEMGVLFEHAADSEGPVGRGEAGELADRVSRLENEVLTLRRILNELRTELRQRQGDPLGT
jgi:hypothetical protein